LTGQSNLSYKKIIRFWIPLSATWLMMALEMPFLTAVIARLEHPEFNLAAFGVAYSIALIMESPVMMILSTSTALVENKNTFLKLRNFVYSLNWLRFILMVLFILPPVFNFFAFSILELPPRVAHLSHMAVTLLIPWAPAIGYRRFYQGILIRQNLTRFIAYGTVIRIFSMALAAVILLMFTNANGVIVGAAALSFGVIIEAIAAKIMSINPVVKYLNGMVISAREISYREINRFYIPLALTTFISLGFQPVVTFFITHSRNALESLAVIPVLNALVFFFRGFGLSIPEVVIALMRNKDDYAKLKNAARVLAFTLVAVLGIIAFTPLSELWLVNISGLSIGLAQVSILPLMLYAIFPSLNVWLNFQRAVLILGKETKPLTVGIIVEVVGMFLVLFVSINMMNAVGIIAAVIAIVLGRLASNVYLVRPYKKVMHKINVV
jgi:Na+-driven multidrug efflux pump